MSLIKLAIIALIFLFAASCTKKECGPSYVNVSVPELNININYDYYYKYDNKIYAINDTSTTIVNVEARRMYYVYNNYASVYTDSLIDMFRGEKGAVINLINVKM